MCWWEHTKDKGNLWYTNSHAVNIIHGTLLLWEILSSFALRLLQLTHLWWFLRFFCTNRREEHHKNSLRSALILCSLQSVSLRGQIKSSLTEELSLVVVHWTVLPAVQSFHRKQPPCQWYLRIKAFLLLSVQLGSPSFVCSYGGCHNIIRGNWYRGGTFSTEFSNPCIGISKKFLSY